jgi:predicted nucleic acid-binding Zn ribbon protein
MTNRKHGKPIPMGEALKGYLARAGLAKRIAQAQVIPDWPRLVGPQIAAVTAPESVAPDGTLFVRVATSAWMNELQLMAPQIMAAINGRGRRIKTIRWLLSR